MKTTTFTFQLFFKINFSQFLQIQMQLEAFEKNALTHFTFAYDVFPGQMELTLNWCVML